MIFLVQSLLTFTIQAKFSFDEFDKTIEIQSKAFDMVFFNDYFVVVTSNLLEVQVLVVSQNFDRITQVLEFKGKNEYKPVRILRNSTDILLVMNVVLRDIQEIPEINEQILLNGIKEQVVFVVIELNTWTVQRSLIVGQCFTGNKTAFDAQIYGKSVLITGKSGCSNVAELDVVGRNTIQLSLAAIKFSAFIINNFLYLISDSSQLSLSKHDLYLNQIWSNFITTSQLVDLSIHDTFFYILTKSSLLKIDENGKILYNKFFSSKSFTKLLVTNSGIYLLSQDPYRSLTWLSVEMDENSERIYLNISKFISITQFNSSTFAILHESFTQTSSFVKTFLSRSIQPFSQILCHESCLSCFGPFNSSCFTCRYFKSEAECGLCHESCGDCYGPLDSNCYTCKSGFIYYEQKCYKNLSCSLGTFQNFLRETCQTCDPACETCKGISFNDCLKCKAGYVSDLNSCVLTCPKGKYPDKGNCQICDYRCAKCSAAGLNSCIECRSGYLLYENTCLESCPEKTWKNSGLCTKCLQNCSFCVNSSCFTCEERFFKDNGNCLPCGPGCHSCNSSSECLTCDEGLTKTSGLCSLECDVGFYSNGLQCLPCDLKCKTCSGPLSSDCLSCETSLLFFNSTCIDFQSGCPSNYFESSGICIKCTENCLKCLNKVSCIYCENSFVLNDGKCDKCHEENCKCSAYCENCQNGICQQCLNPFVLYLNDCVEKCPDGYFETENTCLCQDSCKVCQEESCLHCVDGFFNFNGTCLPCSDGCFTCKNQYECAECTSQKFLSYGKCGEDCPEGFMSVNKTCLKCPDRCKKCQVSGCIECLEDFSKKGYYEKVNQTCLPSINCIAGHEYSSKTLKCEKSFKSSLFDFLKAFL